MKMTRRILPLLLAFLMLVSTSALAEQAPAKRQLVVASYLFEPYIAPFEAENLDVEVVSIDWGERSYEALVNNLVTNAKGFDLFALETDAYDMNTLVAKGYLAPLDEQALTDGAKEMYKGIQDAVFFDSQLYGWPMELEMFGLGADTALFEKLNIPLPRSFQEMFELVNTWEQQPEDVREKYIILSDVSNYRGALLMKLVDQYAALYQYKNQPLTFETPLFREIMQGLDNLSEAMDFDFEDEVRMDFVDNAIPLISVGHGMLSSGDYKSNYPLQLVYEGEQADFYPGVLTLAILNANSDNKDLAQRFLAFIKDKTSPQTQTLLYDRPFEPVESPYYPDSKKQWEDKKAKLEEAIKTSEPAGKQALEDELAAHLMSLELYVEPYRYVVSPKSFALWQGVAQRLFIPPPATIMKGGDAFGTHLLPLMQRYEHKNINSEQFIKEVESLIQLIISENE